MTGIRTTQTGYQAYIRIQGRLYAKRFPFGTPLKEMKDWRRDKEVAIRTGATIPTIDPVEWTFREDVLAYFNIIQSMPSLSDRKYHLALWANVFGGKSRSQITPQMIRSQLETWRQSGLSAGSCNRRRTALMSLWTTLDGKSARNPVRDVPKYHEGDGELRALSHGIIYRILCRMRPSKTRARLRVIAWTGWPHTQVANLKAEHLDLKHGQAFVTPRRKGRGHQADWLPLLPPAVTALKDFDKWDAYGTFSRSAMHSAFARAVGNYNAHRAQYDPPRRPIVAHPYDLRHSFGVLVAALFKDDQVVQRLMLHSNPLQTQRYIRAARAYRLAESVATLAIGSTFSTVISRLRHVGETGEKSKK